MTALRKDINLARVFIAGEYWKTINGKDPKEEARKLGFGIMFESGDDLTVIPNQE